MRALRPGVVVEAWTTATNDGKPASWGPCLLLQAVVPEQGLWEMVRLLPGHEGERLREFVDESHVVKDCMTVPEDQIKALMGLPFIPRVIEGGVHGDGVPCGKLVLL